MRSCGAYSHECLENEEADHDGLDEKEDGVELMISLVSRDRGGDQALRKVDVVFPLKE